MSDTPIFDRLAAERGYSRMLSGGSPAFTGVRLTQPARPLSYSETTDAIKLVMAPGAYVDEWHGGQTDNDVNAALTDEDEKIYTPEHLPNAGLKAVARQFWAEPESEEVVYVKPIPVTTLADLAKGTQQE